MTLEMVTLDKPNRPGKGYGCWNMSKEWEKYHFYGVMRHMAPLPFANGHVSHALESNSSPASGTCRTAFLSPLGLTLIVITTIALAEAAIMVSLSFLQLNALQQVLYDAIVLSIFSLPILYLFVYRPLVLQINEQKRVEREREALICELQRTLDEVRTLRGLLPICAWCKNIRDSKGDWKPLETYISSHSDAEFTHSICPECYQHMINR